MSGRLSRLLLVFTAFLAGLGVCLGAIYWARPARVFYACTSADAAAAGFDDAFIYKELKKSPSLRRIPMVQLQREESLAIFSAWNQQQNKKPY